MNRFLLNKVALDSLSSITQWGFPGESAGSPGHITHLQVSWRSRQVYSNKMKTFPPMVSLENDSIFILPTDYCSHGPVHTQHSHSDFNHFVSGGTLCIDYVSASVAQLAVGDGDH